MEVFASDLPLWLHLVLEAAYLEALARTVTWARSGGGRICQSLDLEINSEWRCLGIGIWHSREEIWSCQRSQRSICWLHSKRTLGDRDGGFGVLDNCCDSVYRSLPWFAISDSWRGQTSRVWHSQHELAFCSRARRVVSRILLPAAVGLRRPWRDKIGIHLIECPQLSMGWNNVNKDDEDERAIQDLEWYPNQKKSSRF